MKVQEFLQIMQKVIKFQIRLAEENIIGKQAETVLKIYIEDLTSRINTNMLKVV